MGLPIVFRFNLSDEERFGPELIALLRKSHPRVTVDPINKAFLRNVPKTADGKIDYAAIPTGSTIWITVTDAASPMHGRHIPITKRGDGSMSLDPHAAEAAGYHFGSYMNELKGRAHSTLSTGQEKQTAKDEEKEKAAKEARKEREPLERKMKELRIEQKQREKEAFDKFIESTGIQKTGLTKEDKTKIFETAQEAAIQNGLDEQQSKVFAKTITSQIDLEDRKRKEEAAIHHQKRIRALADIWGDKKRDEEPESEPAGAKKDSETPEYAVHPHEMISAGSTPEEPLKVSSINVAELAKQVAQEIEETGQDKLHHVEVMAQDALRNAIQEDYIQSGSGTFDSSHDMPGPAAPSVVNEIENEMAKTDPNIIKIGEGLDTLKPVTEIKDPEAFKKTMEAYNELAEIKAQSIALAHEMPKLERLQITAPASLEAFRMDAVVADEKDIEKAYQHLEDSRFEGGYGSFYEALSEHWNETEGYANISSHVIDGSTSALTAILGKNLGRNYDIRRVVEALGPQGASVVIAVELRRKLGQEGFDKFREKLMYEHAANVDKTEKEAIKKHIELKKQLDKVIHQKNNGELLNEASIQTMQTDILLRQRQNLGQAFGSLNATGDLIQSMEKLSSMRIKSQVLGKDAIEVKINCGNDIVTAQDRLVELGLGELKPDGSFKIKGKDGMVKVLDPKASGTGKYQIVTDGLYLADRFTKSKMINGTSSEDLHRIKTDDSPVTAAHNPPGFRSSFFDPISETRKDFTLRKSQRNDINFLLKAGGGVITRTTGAGKTNTILGVAAHRIQENPNYRQLVAVPNGQVRQWVNEAAQFMDYNVVSHPEIGRMKGEERMNAIRELASKVGKRSVVEIPEGLTAQERQHLYGANKGGSIYVSSHKDISTDVNTIEGQGFHGLAIDEPHMLTAKGGGKISAPGKRIMAIPAQHKIATTATLTRDKLVEAHDIVNWAARKPQLGPDGLPRVNRHNGAILYDKPIGSRVAFQGSVGGFGSGTNSQDEAISELITNRFKDYVSGDALKERDYKVNTQKIENITRSQAQIDRQKEIEASVDKVKKEILADEIAKNNERGADSRYSQQKLIRTVNERTRREVQRLHENNLYGGVDNSKTKAFGENLKRDIAAGKTHHVVLVGSGEQRRSVADAVRELGIKGTRKGVFTVTSDTSKKDIERIKEAWKSSKDPAVIILDSSTSAGHNLQEAHAMHVLGNPRDAATWKQFEGRGDRPGRLGDLDINLYRYEDSPHEDVHWNRLFDQAKIGRATAPGLFKSMVRSVKAYLSKANPAWPSELRDEKGRWAKIGDGDFGPIFTDIHDGDAVKLLIRMQTGEVRGAFHHPILGAIDLVWGVVSGKGKSAKGFGLAKIVEKHPEVVETLPTIVRRGKITSETSDKAVLVSGQYKSVVQLHWNSKNKKWLLTSYETEKSPSMRKTADTSHALVGGRRSDTALPPQGDLLKSIYHKEIVVKNIELPIVFKFKRSV